MGHRVFLLHSSGLADGAGTRKPAATGRRPGAMNIRGVGLAKGRRPCAAGSSGRSARRHFAPKFAARPDRNALVLLTLNLTQGAIGDSEAWLALARQVLSI
jgi:hypothetical protein